MATSEQIAVLRAIAEGDLDRHAQRRDALQASDRLDDYDAVLAAAFGVAVRQYLAGRYRHRDVVNLVAEARIALDPTGVAIDPSYVEFIVRDALGDDVDLDGLPDSAYPRTYKLICNHLATQRRLGDPDTFMVKVQRELDADAAEPPEPARRREVTAEDAAALAGMLAGVVVGIGLAVVVGAVTGRRRDRRPARWAWPSGTGGCVAARAPARCRYGAPGAGRRCCCADSGWARPRHCGRRWRPWPTRNPCPTRPPPWCRSSPSTC